MALDNSVVWAGSDISAGYSGMIKLLEQAPNITGVVIANVVTAIGALAALRDKNISVPENLSIVALHDTPFAAHVHPPLTCVSMPLTSLGEEAVKLLLSTEGSSGKKIVVNSPKPHLVVRTSCAVLAP